MDRCPTCRARYRGAPFCHRCQTDLRQVLAIERAAARHRRQALTALDRGCADEARAGAHRACALHRAPDSLIVRAMVALRDRDFPLALSLWREIRQAAGPTGAGGDREAAEN